MACLSIIILVVCQTISEVEEGLRLFILRRDKGMQYTSKSWFVDLGKRNG